MNCSKLILEKKNIELSHCQSPTHSISHHILPSHRRRSRVQGLLHRTGRGGAAPQVHQSHDTPVLPAQRDVGHSQPVSVQGPAAAHGDRR